jgi:quercetin dioxygenase-like cupin family protein
MGEEQFHERLREHGYGEGEFKDFAPNLDGPMHTHDFSVMLMVVSGEFTLAQPDGARTFRPGELCELAAGSPHAERTGPGGARVILGKK